MEICTVLMFLATTDATEGAEKHRWRATDFGSKTILVALVITWLLFAFVGWDFVMFVCRRLAGELEAARPRHLCVDHEGGVRHGSVHRGLEKPVVNDRRRTRGR